MLLFILQKTNAKCTLQYYQNQNRQIERLADTISVIKNRKPTKDRQYSEQLKKDKKQVMI